MVATDSSEVACAVTRSVSSWASSTTRTWCSGSTFGDPDAAMPSIAWLVTTTSASRDAAFALSGKHSASIGHLLPRHSSEVTDT